MSIWTQASNISMQTTGHNLVSSECQYGHKLVIYQCQTTGHNLVSSEYAQWARSQLVCFNENQITIDTVIKAESLYQLMYLQIYMLNFYVLIRTYNITQIYIIVIKLLTICSCYKFAYHYHYRS